MGYTCTILYKVKCRFAVVGENYILKQNLLQSTLKYLFRNLKFSLNESSVNYNHICICSCTFLATKCYLLYPVL